MSVAAACFGGKTAPEQRPANSSGAPPPAQADAHFSVLFLPHHEPKTLLKLLKTEQNSIFSTPKSAFSNIYSYLCTRLMRIVRARMYYNVGKNEVHR